MFSIFPLKYCELHNKLLLNYMVNYIRLWLIIDYELYKMEDTNEICITKISISYFFHLFQECIILLHRDNKYRIGHKNY